MDTREAQPKAADHDAEYWDRRLRILLAAARREMAAGSPARVSHAGPGLTASEGEC